MSSIMGKLLLRLVLPSVPNAHQMANFNRPLGVRGLLSRFLAVRAPGSASLIPASQLYKIPADAGLWTTMRYSFAITTRLVFVGSPAWCDADPVWSVPLFLLYTVPSWPLIVVGGAMLSDWAYIHLRKILSVLVTNTSPGGKFSPGIWGTDRLLRWTLKS